VIFPAAAAAAAVALRRGAIRWGGVLLLVSVATPTYVFIPDRHLYAAGPQLFCGHGTAYIAVS